MWVPAFSGFYIRVMGTEVTVPISFMSELFPDADYRFQMNLERGSVEEFFRATAAHETILSERRHWLDTDRDRHFAMLKEGELLLEEAVEVLGTDVGNVEPDVLLLDAQLRLLGACVCFPSSWNLAEKIGRPLDLIHQVVPGLNEQIGIPIARFLSNLKPGYAWLRANWGLSRSGELNQHPERRLPRLEASTTFDEIWLRIEYQALVLLPRTHGVLFGIRIETYPLSEIRNNNVEAHGLARALRTMPEDMARYKGIAAVRESVARALTL